MQQKAARFPILNLAANIFFYILKALRRPAL